MILVFDPAFGAIEQMAPASIRLIRTRLLWLEASPLPLTPRARHNQLPLPCYAYPPLWAGKRLKTGVAGAARRGRAGGDG